MSINSGPEVRRRLAWLLRVNRVFGASDALAVGSAFAREFRRMDTGGPVHRAQVIRWEAGDQPVHLGVLREYERILGLDDATLTTVADFASRMSWATTGPPALRRPATGDERWVRSRTDELLDKALGSGPVAGSEWEELTTCFAAQPGLHLYPSRLADTLAQRLVMELLIAEAAGWLHRAEALNRLLGIEWMAEAIVRACASLVVDRSNEVFGEPLGLLADSGIEFAGRTVLEQVLTPTNDRALRSAWASAAEKTAKRHFGPAQLRLLARAALDAVSAGDQSRPYRGAALDLLRRIPPGLLSRADGEKAQRWCEQERSDNINTQIDVGTTAARIAAAALRAMPRDASDTDPVLVELVQEMLFEPQISRGLAATYLIAATPYRLPVAAVLIRELRDRTGLDDPVLAPAAVRALAVLGDEAARPVLAKLTLASGIAGPVTEAATWSLAHVAGRSDDRYWQAVTTIRSEDPSLGRGLVYALGVDRNFSVLHAYAANAEMPGHVRSAAAWWLRLPSGVLASTARK